MQELKPKSGTEDWRRRSSGLEAFTYYSRPKKKDQIHCVFRISNQHQLTTIRATLKNQALALSKLGSNAS